MVNDPKIKDALIHSSGHENGEGIKLVPDTIKPKRVLPIPQSGQGYEAFKKIAGERRLSKERVVEL